MIDKRVACFLVLVCLAFHHVALAQLAVPPLSGRVVDQAAILSPDTEMEVTNILATHEEATSNQVVVLTVGSLQGEVLEEYSLSVARAWQLGQEGRNNGVLLLIAYADRKMRIEVGYGLEGDLPDVKARRIIDNDIRPYFRNQDFDGGVLNGVRAIVGTIEGSYEPEASSDDIEDAPLIFRLIFGGMFLGMPLMALYGTIFQQRMHTVVLAGFLYTISIGGRYRIDSSLRRYCYCCACFDWLCLVSVAYKSFA